MTATIKLGVNIDHVATLRQVRRASYPDPLLAALVAEQSGADSITLHLREDRRHIQDHDVERMRASLQTRMNLEMAATDEMLRIALRVRPQDCCLVPERREERTTEGGLDVVSGAGRLTGMVSELKNAGCRVSLFVEADPRQLDAARDVGADIVELHTGRYCDLMLENKSREGEQELNRLRNGARHAADLGLEVHAGHGLTFNTVKAVAAFPEVVELNIGHFLVGEGIFVGLDRAVAQMRAIMADARGLARQPAPAVAK